MTVACIAGKNRIAVEAAKHIRDTYGQLDLRVLPCVGDDGLDSWQPSLKCWALSCGVMIASLDDLYPVSDLLFISLEYDRLIVPSNFATKRLYNIHFSLLPEYKGSYTSIWPILDGKDYSGVTLHKIDDGIDTGDIIVQKRIPIMMEDTSRTIYEKYLTAGSNLLRQWMPLLITDTISAFPQSHSDSTFKSRRSIDFRTLSIDLKQTAYTVHNQIRAFTFREYQLPTVHGVAISGSKILNERSTARPSEVIEETENEFRIATIDYDIILYKDLLELLFSACRNAAPEDVIMRLISNPIDLNTKNANGWSVLMVAAYNYHKVAVELLVKNGANVNQSNYKGTTILMYAKSAPSRGRDLSMIKWLIEKGADINARDKSGRTILSYARSDGDFDLAGLLIGYGGCE